MSELIDTTQMYLRTVVELEEEGVAPMRARIAERLQQSSPTVSQTVARMERDGLLTLTEDRVIELTPAGRAEALRVMRRHRLAECLLVDKIGVDLGVVHDEACRWEHVIGEAVEAHLAAYLGMPTHSPYGNPIPVMAELGTAGPQERLLDGVWSVAAAAAAGESRGRAVRLSENLQRDPAVLADVVAAGVVPGAEVTFGPDGDGIEVIGPSGRVLLGDGMQASLYVARGGGRAAETA